MKNNKKVNKIVPKTQDNIKYYLGLIAVLFLTLLAYSNIWNNQFLNFDDREYFTAYPEIVNLSFNNIKAYFTNYYVSMYQPLPVLSFALSYKLFGLNNLPPWHAVNLIFHLLNVVMVFLVVNSLAKNKNIGLFVSFLFALHPMNVEAVTWISARSSGMFVLFYLTALLFYIKYVNSKNNYKFLFFSLLFFLLSLLSKAQAVTLSLIVVIIDYYFKRNINIKLIVEKIPFFLLSIAFGIIALMQKGASESTLSIYEKFSVIDNFFLISYAISFYIVRLFIPVNLSCTYIYPDKVNGFLPLETYAAPILIITIAFFIFRYRHKRFFVFGLLFFLASISLTLQIIPSRWVITADRYAYLPFIGLLFVVANFIFDLKKSKLKTVLIYASIFLGLIFSLVTFNRNKVWQNSESLWTDAINKNPKNAIAYNNRGTERNMKNDFTNAIDDFTNAISINSQYFEALYNRGLAYQNLNKLDEALKDYNTAIEINPSYEKAYNNRGSIKMALKDIDGARGDFNNAIQINPANAQAFINRGALNNLVEDFDAAVIDFSQAINLNPKIPLAYINRGFSYFKLNKQIEACADWRIAAKLGSKEALDALETSCN